MYIRLPMLVQEKGKSLALGKGQPSLPMNVLALRYMGKALGKTNLTADICLHEILSQPRESCPSMCCAALSAIALLSPACSAQSNHWRGETLYCLRPEAASRACSNRKTLSIWTWLRIPAGAFAITDSVNRRPMPGMTY